MAVGEVERGVREGKRREWRGGDGNGIWKLEGLRTWCWVGDGRKGKGLTRLRPLVSVLAGVGVVPVPPLMALA
jgi:hypothetical protein